MATPPTSACWMDERKPNKTNATTMDSSVSDVRSFFRFKLLQMRWKNFMARSNGLVAADARRRTCKLPKLSASLPRWLQGIGSFHRFVAELTLVQIHRPRRARRGVRIVRDHDDGLAVLPVQRLEQIQDFIAGLAVKVAGRLIAQQQRRVGDNSGGGARRALVAAGKRPR